MTEQAQAGGGPFPRPTAEVNVFATTPGGYRCHFKLVFPEAAGVLIGLNNLERLIEGLVNRGYTPDVGAGAARGGAAQPAEQPGKAKPATCELCGSLAIIAEPKRNDKSPDWRCSACDAAAWNRKDGTFTWRASTR